MDPSDIRNFEIIWHIQNFPFCWHKTGEWLESSLFKVYLPYETSWKLWLYPRGEDDGEYISCYLFRENGGPEVVDVDFELQLSVGEILLKSSASFFKMCSFKIHQREGLKYFIPRWEVFPLIADQNETFDLSFICTIFNRERSGSRSVKITTLTRIEIKRISGTEVFYDDQNIDQDCNRDINVKPILGEESLININLSCVEESLVIDIRPMSCEAIKYAACKIAVVKNWGNDPPIEHIRSWIGEVKKDIWRYSVPFPEKESLKPDFEPPTYKAFFLRYNFMYTTGVMAEKSGLECDAHMKTRYFPLQKYFNDGKKIAKYAPTALDALKDVYISQSFTDDSFRTESKKYPVHKALVSARSPKLKTFYGFVDGVVINLNVYTAEQLILFLYTDTVKLHSFSTAIELFRIAFYFDVELLKETCRNFVRDKFYVHPTGDILRIISLFNFLVPPTVEDFFVTHYDSLLRHKAAWKYLALKPDLFKQVLHRKYRSKKLG